MAPAPIASARADQWGCSQASEPHADNGRAPGHQGQPAKAAAGGVLHQRRGDADAFGDVVQRETEHEEGAEPAAPAGEGGTDRETLAEVVQADPEGDVGRQRQPGRGAAAPADDP